MSSFDSFKIQILNLFKRSKEHKTRVHKFVSVLNNFDWYTPEDPEIETYRTTKFLTKKLEIMISRRKPSFPGAHVPGQIIATSAEVTLKWWWKVRESPWISLKIHLIH